MINWPYDRAKVPSLPMAQFILINDSDLPMATKVSGVPGIFRDYHMILYFLSVNNQFEETSILEPHNKVDRRNS